MRVKKKEFTVGDSTEESVADCTLLSRLNIEMKVALT